MLSLSASIITIFFDITSVIVTLLPIYYCQCGMLIPTISIVRACARGTHLTTVPVDDARDERRLAHARVHSERSGRTAVHLPLAARLVGVLAR